MTFTPSLPHESEPGPAGDGEEPEGIAVIGMAGRFPGARDLDEFWANLCAGREHIVDIPEEELTGEGVPRGLLDDPDYVRRAAPIDGVAEFDAEFFGFTPQAARNLDPQQRLFLQLCTHALQDAGTDPGRYDGSIGVFGTSSVSSYLLYNLLSRHDTRTLLGGGLGLDLVQLVGGNDPNFIATRVSHALDLRGPALGVQTACSSSLVAVHLACQSLLSGECDMALAGGASLRIPHRAGYLYDQGSIMSSDGRCRPFDAQADGTVFGSGGGAVLLKPLADALADGDPVRAVIRGSAINNDGSRKMGFTAPSIDGQAEVIAEALAIAGFPPDTVGYIEAHGTGTSLGDPIETAALSTVFPGGPGGRRIVLGSVKSNIGHLEVAAGIAGLIKTVLAMEHRQLPGTVHYTRPNPEIDLDRTPFEVRGTVTPWHGPGPLRAGVSALGVGGTNAHVVLESAPERPAPEPSGAPAVLLVSARHPEQLEESARLLADALDRSGDELADVAHTLAEGRQEHQHRRAVVAATPREAAAILRDPAHAAAYTGRPAGDTPTAVFLMPGQGSQYPGMTRGLHQADPGYREHFDRAAEGLSDLLGLDLRAACFDGDADLLRRTDVAQAALFAVEYALARRLADWDVHPAALAGHSVGEYTAACLAGVLTLDDALRVVAERGTLMRTAPPGSMITVRLPEDDVRAELAGTGLEIAAVNEFASCVVAGPSQEARALAERLAGRGTEVRELHTAHAFHTAALGEAADRFAERINGIRFAPPRIPLVSAVTGDWMTDEEATDPQRWARQIRVPVRFAQALRTVLAEPGRTLVECGPGRALTTFARRNPAWGEQHRALRLVRHPQEDRDDHRTFLLGLGALWTAGHRPDWSTGHPGRAARRVSLPGYPFRRTEHWIAPRLDQDAAPAPAPDGEVTAAPGDARSTAAAPAPADGLEELIARIWSEVLGIPEVSPHDNFFDLGGDSMVAVQAASRATRLGHPMTPQELFRHQTVAALAAALGEEQTTEGAPGTAPATDFPPLTPTQWRVVERSGERLGAFAVPMLLEIAGTVDTETVRSAVRAVVDHHESFRLRLEWRDGLLEQRIAGPEPLEVPSIPLGGSGDPASAEVRAALDDLGRGLGPGSGPLLRAAVLDPGPGGTRHLALVMHHFCVDNASERILLEDLTTACTQLSLGRPVDLPPVGTPWSSWAQWVASLAADRQVLTELGEWLVTLGTAASPGLPALPVAEPGPSARVRLASVELDEATTAALTGLQRTRRAQLDEFLLGAVAATVTEIAGTDRLLVDVEGQGRAVLPPGMDLGRTTGTCTTMHPIAVDVGRKGVDGAVESARRALRATPREGLGYGVLRTLHGPSAARLAGLPAPDLLVSYLGAVTYDAVAELQDGPLRPAADAGLSARAVPGCLTHGTELRAYLHGGRLHLDWWYDAAAYDRGLVEKACDRTAAALRDLVRGGTRDRQAASQATPWDDVSNDDLAVLFGEQRHDK